MRPAATITIAAAVAHIARMRRLRRATSSAVTGIKTSGVPGSLEVPMTLPMIEEMKKIQLITDGACLGNPGPGGWACILRHGDVKRELFGSAPHTTNNRMELTAAIEGLGALKQPCEVEVVTDSEYVKNGISTWIHGWKRNGWRTSAKKPVVNQDLWTELDDAANG